MKNSDRVYRKDSLVGKIDWVVLLIYFILVSIGVATIYSTAFQEQHPSLLDFSTKYGKQIVWIGISFFLGFLIFLIDATIYQKFAFFIYGFCLFLLVIVLFTPPINGARAWLGVGSMGIQPAEFAKIGTALALARFIPTLNIRNLSIKEVLQTNGILFVPMILILMQPDAGSVVVFTAFLFVFYREGISYEPIMLKFLHFIGIRRFQHIWIGNHFIPVIFIAIIISTITLLISNNTITFDNFPTVELPGMYSILLFFVGIFILLTIFTLIFVAKRSQTKMIILFLISLLIVSSIVVVVDRGFQSLPKHQKERIELFLGLRQDPNGDDYNRNRAMAAVGSGGLIGKGYRQATLSSTEANHVPESETDFIFCPLSEEWGFFGSAFIVVLFCILLVRIIVIAERQRSDFNRIYAYTVATILFYHFAINIGMDIGLAPVIGIPLPFISYGGSSMMSFSVMLFILLKLDSQRFDLLS